MPVDEPLSPRAQLLNTNIQSKVSFMTLFLCVWRTPVITNTELSPNRFEEVLAGLSGPGMAIGKLRHRAHRGPGARSTQGARQVDIQHPGELARSGLFHDTPVRARELSDQQADREGAADRSLPEDRTAGQNAHGWCWRNSKQPRLHKLLGRSPSPTERALRRRRNWHWFKAARPCESSTPDARTTHTPEITYLRRRVINAARPTAKAN
jgi:hypothetical protein